MKNAYEAMNNSNSAEFHGKGHLTSSLILSNKIRLESKMAYFCDICKKETRGIWTKRGFLDEWGNFKVFCDDCVTLTSISLQTPASQESSERVLVSEAMIQKLLKARKVRGPGQVR